jgi:HD superfamily phosphohydrolase YqeK
MKINSGAKDFFEEKLNDEKIKIHSECVIECACNFIQETDLKEIIFEIAGWIHDIGRKYDKENHHKIGLMYMDEFLKKNSQFEVYRDEIADCILNHRSNGKPRTIYGKIMQIADKLALKHKKWIEYKNLSLVSKEKY